MNCFSNPGWKVLVLTVEREAGERICKKLMKGRKEGKRKKIKGKQRTRRGKVKEGTSLGSACRHTGGKHLTLWFERSLSPAGSSSTPGRRLTGREA